MNQKERRNASSPLFVHVHFKSHGSMVFVLGGVYVCAHINEAITSNDIMG